MNIENYAKIFIRMPVGDFGFVCSQQARSSRFERREKQLSDSFRVSERMAR